MKRVSRWFDALIDRITDRVLLRLLNHATEHLRDTDLVLGFADFVRLLKEIQ